LGKPLGYGVAAILCLVAGIYADNTSLIAAHHQGRPDLLAHRGMAQRFDERDLTNDTCTATRMLAPTHDYLENTLRAMQAPLTPVLLSSRSMSIRQPMASSRCSTTGRLIAAPMGTGSPASPR